MRTTTPASVTLHGPAMNMAISADRLSSATTPPPIRNRRRVRASISGSGSRLANSQITAPSTSRIAVTPGNRLSFDHGSTRDHNHTEGDTSIHACVGAL